MKTAWVRMACILTACCFSAGLLVAQGRDYVDPDGEFALRVPEGWQSVRAPIPDAGWVTTFTRGNAHVAVAVLRSSQPLDPSMLDSVGGALLASALQQIQLGGVVYSQSIQRTATTIGGVSGAALRCDLEFSSAEAGGARQKGYMLALLGRRVAVLASVSAPLADTAGYQSADLAMRTLAVESRVSVGSSVSAAGGASAVPAGARAADLSSMAGKFKGGVRRESRDEVLCAGSPPLTYGSVAAFAELVGECFDVQLTEAEFEATRQRFMEYYRKQNPEGKAMLAQGWGKLLQEIRAAQGPDRAGMVDEVRKVMADRFHTGAQAGIGWAVTMEEAIAKRSQSVARASAQKPAFANDKRFDNDFSQADLEASLEMLYFMWVASGRDASLVTADTVAQVQATLVQGYATFPPDLQYVLANAQQIYAGLRSQWESAGARQRIQMAQVFGQQLDALGFTVPRPRQSGGNSGGAWSDWEGKSHAQFAGEMVVGLAGSSYKSAW